MLQTISSITRNNFKYSFLDNHYLKNKVIKIIKVEVKEMKCKTFNAHNNKKIEAKLNKFLEENSSLNIRFVTQTQVGLNISTIIFYD